MKKALLQYEMNPAVSLPFISKLKKGILLRKGSESNVQMLEGFEALVK